MKKQTKMLLLIFSIIMVFIVLIVIYRSSDEKDNFDIGKWRDKNLVFEFKGKIINFRKSERCYITCIKLDYSSVDSVYFYEKKICCFKLQNGKALIAVSSDLIENYKIDYVEINMNNDRKEKFYSKGKLVETYNELDFGGINLTEEEMKFCDE